ncbi:MAG: hypothetical protein ACREH9_10015 [Pseudomonadota bacterium]
MPQGYFDQTKATARLPNLDIEIVHGHSADGNAEHISISLQAAPTFAAFGRLLDATNPFLFWMRFVQTAWAPWLGAAPASLPPGKLDRLPATADIAGLGATHHGDDVG